MKTLIQKLAKIGVSEFILVFLLALALGGAFALSSSNVNFRQIILPPPPPVITTIMGDSQTRAVLVIGSSSLPNASVRVYAFSHPLFVETTPDAERAFLAAFTADVLPPGAHEFTATTVLNENQSTDPSLRVAVQVNDDYTIEPAKGGAVQTVKIGNADSATSELLRTIIRNQKAARQPLPNELPRENANATRARLIQLGLFLVIVLETVLLLFQRARRKNQAGKNFFHLGKGFYRLPPPPPVSTGHPPAQ